MLVLSKKFSGVIVSFIVRVSPSSIFDGATTSRFLFSVGDRERLAVVRVTPSGVISVLRFETAILDEIVVKTGVMVGTW